MLNVLKKAIKKILLKLPLRNIVLFESCPDYSDNTLYVFKEFVARNYNKKYKLIWICNEEFERISDKNVYFVNRQRHRKLVTFLNHIAKVVICCNDFLGVDRADQDSYYLMHGSPIKNITNYYTCPNYIKFMITAGAYMNSKSAKSFMIDESKCIPLGYPRNDVLVKPRCCLKEIFGDYKKIIIWYPTVKQFKNGRNYGVEPIPFFENKNNIKTINDCANKENVLIVIKPHFAQVKNVDTNNYSNIVFINEEFLNKNKITSYELLSASDALLTDYSSVLYDYMICNKPIGLIWYDIDVFSKNVGVYDYYQESTSGCCKIYNLEDLISFLTNISNDQDELQEAREKMCNIINAPKDEQNTQRVVDFIINKSNL